MRHAFRRRALAAVLSSAASLALVSPSAADEPGAGTIPITVVAIQTSDADDQAEALTKALRNVVRATPGWSPGEGDYSLEVLVLSLKCAEPPDANCESRIADQIHADRYLWGAIHKKGSNVEGELHFWVRGKGSTKVPVSYSANLTESNEESLKRVATEALTNLTGGPPKGSVHVKAGSVAAQVFVDGQPMGALDSGEGTLLVPAGSHKILVKASGYADAETTILVKPTGANEVSLTMIPAEPETPTDWRKIGGFIALGSGVAFGAIGLFATLKVSSLNDGDWDKAINETPETEDICDKAEGDSSYTRGTLSNGDIKQRCSDAPTFEIMQAVFYPLAGVVGGVGIYLLATSTWSSSSSTGKLEGGKKTQQASSFAIKPQISPSAGKLDVTFRW